MLGVLPGRDIDAVVIKYRCGIDLARPLGSRIFDLLAFLVLFVLGWVRVVPTNIA